MVSKPNKQPHFHPRCMTCFYPAPAFHSAHSHSSRDTGQGMLMHRLTDREIMAQGRIPGGSSPREAEHLKHSTAVTRKAHTARPTESSPRSPKRQAGMRTFHSTFHSPFFTTALRQTSSKAPREAQALGFVHLNSPNGLEGGKRETGGEAESWLRWLQEKPKASSSWPHLLQLCPPCPQHMTAKGYKLKVPKETWPSLTKSSKDKSKDKPRITLSL